MRVLIAVDEPHGSDLARGLEAEGLSVVAVVAASALVLAAAEDGNPGWGGIADALAEAEALVLETTRATLDSGVVAACDRRAVRIVPLTAALADDRVSQAFGLEQALPLGIEAWQLAERLASPPALRARTAEHDSPSHAPSQRRVIAVWGPAGSPGRSTVAVELAVELSRRGRHVGLVDADSHAPSIALALGLADEAPGFAAACRQAELGGLDSRELSRISAPLGTTGVDVLTGINRPSRWPELSGPRVAAALDACREWADCTVVDVAASLERDEEIVSDLDGPRRNAATLAALRSADLIVAVAAADPLGISRFLRAHSELRAAIGATPIAVLANRLRPGALGIDARGQVRRTLDRFGGVADVWFLPADARAADAALLAARPIAEVAPRSAVTLGMRRFVGEAVVPAAAESRGLRRSLRGRMPEPVLP